MKLTEVFKIKEAKCPTCGQAGAYHGFNSVECPNQDCRHYKQGMKPEYSPSEKKPRSLSPQETYQFETDIIIDNTDNQFVKDTKDNYDIEAEYVGPGTGLGTLNRNRWKFTGKEEDIETFINDNFCQGPPECSHDKKCDDCQDELDKIEPTPTVDDVGNSDWEPDD